VRTLCPPSANRMVSHWADERDGEKVEPYHLVLAGAVEQRLIVLPHLHK
jgi:hypothetical protein